MPPKAKVFAKGKANAKAKGGGGVPAKAKAAAAKAAGLAKAGAAAGRAKAGWISRRAARAGADGEEAAPLPRPRWYFADWEGELYFEQVANIVAGSHVKTIMTDLEG